MNKRSHFEVGQFFFLNEKYDQAIAEFKKAIIDGPNDVEAYYNLGVVYETKNMMKEAKEAFRKALDLEPKHKLAEEHLSKLVGI